MKKKFWFYCMMMSLAVFLVNCSDDEVNVPDDVIPVLKGSSGIKMNIDGFGFGCDITQEIGNVKGHILNLNALYEDGVIKLDEAKGKFKFGVQGLNYTEATNNLNQVLVGNVASMSSSAFLGNLDVQTHKQFKGLDIYEYGINMCINKLYELTVHPEFVSNLRKYVRESVWNELNATDVPDRTDKAAIKELYKKYGTHLATQVSYGAKYQLVYVREHLPWESNIFSQLKIALNSLCPLPETGMQVSGFESTYISTTDTECYKNSPHIIIEDRFGSDLSIPDMNEWFNHTTAENSAILGYSLGTPSNRDSGLIPLYELLEDGDMRKTAMQEALNEFVKENSIHLETRKMVLIDALGRWFKDGKAPKYIYEKRGDKILKYFRLDEEMLQHVRGVTKGVFHFYYSLGHLVDEAVVDIKFDDASNLDADWETRGDHANTGVTGEVKNRYLCIRTKNVNDGVADSDFITGFGIALDGKVKTISEGTETSFTWKRNGELWFKGLVHDDVYCIFTKDKLKDFF